jgi:hypothetical protein
VTLELETERGRAISDVVVREPGVRPAVDQGRLNPGLEIELPSRVRFENLDSLVVIPDDAVSVVPLVGGRHVTKSPSKLAAPADGGLEDAFGFE